MSRIWIVWKLILPKRGPCRIQRRGLCGRCVLMCVWRRPPATVTNLIIFVLAIYVGYHVVWTVTPALHTPLMAVTNAVSAIVIVGAMLAAALTETTLGKTMGVLAVTLAAVNVFGGFLVTRRMMEMFKKKEKKAPAAQGDAK